MVCNTWDLTLINDKSGVILNVRQQVWEEGGFFRDEQCNQWDGLSFCARAQRNFPFALSRFFFRWSHRAGLRPKSLFHVS